MHIQLFKQACKQNCVRVKFEGSSKRLPYVYIVDNVRATR